MANEILVQASVDARVIYGVKQYAEIVFKNGGIMKGEGLQMLQETRKALDSNENEIYNFLGCEQTERIDIKKVMERLQIQK